MNEIEKINKEREEILRKIEENQRLMEFIQNKNIKGGLNELDLFNKNKAAKKIQNAFQSYKQNLNDKKELEEQKELAKFSLSKKKMGIDVLFSIKKIQRKYMEFILERDRKNIKNYYIGKIRNEFHRTIPQSRIIELRKKLIAKLESMDDIDPNRYEDIINTYFQYYKDFNLNYPEHEELRLNNFFTLFRTQELIKYMEFLNKNEINKFNKFKLDVNKMSWVRNYVNRKENAYNNKTDFYDNFDIDDFEENALLNEIDERYGFEKRSDILNKK